MSLPTFFLEVILISLSGVMAPGPVTAMTVTKGNKSPYAGIFVAIGHGLVEIPLIILISFGFGEILKLPSIKGTIGLLGGLFLLKMGWGLLRGAKQVQIDPAKDNRSPLMAGMILSIANPYLLLWWVAIGSILIYRSLTFGILGFIAFIIFHWSCDLFWCSFLSAISFKGGQFFGERLQQVLFTICGAFLLFFSAKFIFDAMRIFFSY